MDILRTHRLAQQVDNLWCNLVKHKVLGPIFRMRIRHHGDNTARPVRLDTAKMGLPGRCTGRGFDNRPFLCYNFLLEFYCSARLGAAVTPAPKPASLYGGLC